jgi:hypothetical protein
MIRKQSISESLEILEASKIIELYEKKGYKVFPDKTFHRKGKPFRFDLFAVDEKTHDKIIFEIVSPEKNHKQQIGKLLKQRDEYLKYFPEARFVLVVARERKLPYAIKSKFNDMLLKYLKEYKSGFIKTNISAFIDYEEVNDLDFNNIDFNDFNKLSLTGTANLKFWIKIEDEEYVGKALSDGVPFSFNIELLLNSKDEQQDEVYRISEYSTIDFDFSEFIDNK